MNKKIIMIGLAAICLSGCGNTNKAGVDDKQTETIQEQDNGEEIKSAETAVSKQTAEQDQQRLDYIYGVAEKNMDRDVVRDAIRENAVTSDEDQIVKAIYVMEINTSIMVLYWEQPSQNGYTIYHAFGSGSDKKVKADAEVSSIADDLIKYVQLFDNKESKYVQYFDGKEFYEIKPGCFADSENIEEAVWFYIDVTDRMNEINGNH